MQLIGVDPFASPRFDSSAMPSVPAAAGLEQWFAQPGAVVLANGTAATLAIKSGDEFELEAGGRVRMRPSLAPSTMRAGAMTRCC